MPQPANGSGVIGIEGDAPLLMNLVCLATIGMLSATAAQSGVRTRRAPRARRRLASSRR